MGRDFEMSMVGELTFFLGLQIKQLKEGIFVSRGNYVSEFLKKCKEDNGKHASTPTTSNAKLDEDSDDKPINKKHIEA